jgi:hypothetical protein
MTTAPVAYILKLKTRLATSFFIDTFTIVEEKVWSERGYVRIRATLSNGDFLEVAEYFVFEGDRRVTCRYRYQWMDGDCQILRKRWDNVEHYPDLPNFPHHVHIGSEGNVVSGKSMGIIELLDGLSGELSAEER